MGLPERGGRHDAGGRRRAFDLAGASFGTCNTTTDKTVEDSFRIVDTGNQLMGLIERAK